MKWEVVLEKMGQVDLYAGASVDPFMQLAQKAQVLENVGIARLNVNVGRAVGYGEVKCSVSVSIECPQKEAFIDLAGEIAFTKALELANDGMTQFGQPRIGEDDG